MDSPATAGGAEAPTIAPENRAGFACPECDFMAKTKGGLGVHRRARHPTIYHAGLRDLPCPEVQVIGQLRN